LSSLVTLISESLGFLAGWRLTSSIANGAMDGAPELMRRVGLAKTTAEADPPPGMKTRKATAKAERSNRLLVLAFDEVLGEGF
jgi:hypothetical protein